MRIAHAGTFSIVARDGDAGDVGVAVHSKYFAVGNVVPWAAAGVGAIATQAAVNPEFGPEALRCLRMGLLPQAALDQMLAADYTPELRQVGIIDHRGRTASHTGAECTRWAGGICGDDFCAQGNILVGPQVIDAMVGTFEDTAGQLLPERLMRTLETAQEAGGDSRGQQSAALLVVRKDVGIPGFTDRIVDLRVDDHTRPIEELRRLLGMLKAMREW